LDDTKITDTGLSTLAGVSNLQDLFLDATPITDQGLAHLSRFTDLRHLSLNNTKVSASGLMHLCEMTNLRSVQVIHTSITEEQLEEMRLAGRPGRAMPPLEFIYSPFAATDLELLESEEDDSQLHVFL
jgi:hypothetical protein